MNNTFLSRSLFVMCLIFLLVVLLSSIWGWDTSLHRSDLNSSPVIPLIIFFVILGSFFAGVWLVRDIPSQEVIGSEQEHKRLADDDRKEVIEIDARGNTREDEDDELKVPGLITILAEKYDRSRIELPAGKERLELMEQVVHEMTKVAKEDPYDIDDLVESDSPGERLASIVMLQVEPDLNYLDWLAKRVGAEKPFIGKHAALALLIAARSCEPTEQRIVFRYIEQAKESLLQGYDSTTAIEKRERTDRAKILNAAKDELRMESVEDES